MKIKVATKYDYFLAIISLACFIFILLIYRNSITIALAILILLVGFHKSFSSRIIFEDSNIRIRNLKSIKIIAYSDVDKLSYTNKLYGKSFVTVSYAKKNYKALLGYSEWLKLKVWLENKGVAFDDKI